MCVTWINSRHAHGRLSLFPLFGTVYSHFHLYFYISQFFKANALAVQIWCHTI